MRGSVMFPWSGKYGFHQPTLTMNPESAHGLAIGTSSPECRMGPARPGQVEFVRMILRMPSKAMTFHRGESITSTRITNGALSVCRYLRYFDRGERLVCQAPGDNSLRCIELDQGFSRSA
ncbi:MAG: hypothetical protein ACYCOU_11225 [Sulfobacillus sp.]